jgi:hypothetical protein
VAGKNVLKIAFLSQILQYKQKATTPILAAFLYVLIYQRISLVIYKFHLDLNFRADKYEAHIWTKNNTSTNTLILNDHEKT